MFSIANMHFSLCSVSGDLCMTFAVTSVLRLNEYKLFTFIDFCLENKIWCNKLFVYSYYLFTMLLVVQVRSDRLKKSNFGKEEAAAAAKKNQTNKQTKKQFNTHIPPIAYVNRPRREQWGRTECRSLFGITTTVDWKSKPRSDFNVSNWPPNYLS